MKELHTQIDILKTNQQSSKQTQEDTTQELLEIKEGVNNTASDIGKI